MTDAEAAIAAVLAAEEHEATCEDCAYEYCRIFRQLEAARERALNRFRDARNQHRIVEPPAPPTVLLDEAAEIALAEITAERDIAAAEAARFRAALEDIVDRRLADVPKCDFHAWAVWRAAEALRDPSRREETT